MSTKTELQMLTLAVTQLQSEVSSLRQQQYKVNNPTSVTKLSGSYDVYTHSDGGVFVVNSLVSKRQDFTKLDKTSAIAASTIVIDPIGNLVKNRYGPCGL